VWWLVYQSLLPVARYLTYSLFELSEARTSGGGRVFHLRHAKVLMLLTVVVFGVGSSTPFHTGAHPPHSAGKKES